MGNSSTGPFYKKRGYASSQLEMRRESSNPRTAHNHQITPLLSNGLGYERGKTLYQGHRDLGGGSGNFNVEIFLTKKG